MSDDDFPEAEDHMSREEMAAWMDRFTWEPVATRRGVRALNRIRALAGLPPLTERHDEVER